MLGHKSRQQAAKISRRRLVAVRLVTVLLVAFRHERRCHRPLSRPLRLIVVSFCAEVKLRVRASRSCAPPPTDRRRRKQWGRPGGGGGVTREREEESNGERGEGGGREGGGRGRGRRERGGRRKTTPTGGVHLSVGDRLDRLEI